MFYQNNTDPIVGILKAFFIWDIVVLWSVVKLWLTLSFIWLSAQSLKMTPATLFAYMWVFAVLPALTSAIVVVKAVTIFLGDPQRAPLWSSTDWKGQ